MISPINSNSPSFNGIVKIRAILKDGNISKDLKSIENAIVTNDPKFINAATKQLKAILLDKDVPVVSKLKEKLAPNYELFRRIYGHFDPDYRKIDLSEVWKDGRDVFCNNKTGTQRFLLSGTDAASVARKGEYVGEQRVLERRSDEFTGAGEIAAKEYHANKASKVLNYLTSSPNHPTITLYTRLDKTGKHPILMAARMEDDFNKVNLNPNGWTQTVCFDRMMKPKVSKPANTKINTTHKPVSGSPKPVQEEFGFLKTVNQNPKINKKKANQKLKTARKQTKTSPKIIQAEFDFSKSSNLKSTPIQTEFDFSK